MMSEIKVPLTLRVLLLDDESDIHVEAREAADRHALPIDLHCAYSAVEAAELVERLFFDVALLDLVGVDGSLTGLEFVRYLTQIGASCDVVLMTHLDLDLDHSNVINTIAMSDRPRIVRFVDKRRASNFLDSAVEISASRLRDRECGVKGTQWLAELIADRRARYGKNSGAAQLREVDEISVELDRLTRLLFADVPHGTRQSTIAVRFEPIERLGLSAAVVARALVTLGVEGVQSRSSYECVVKVGPREEILEEAGRYTEFVKFGVRLEERVEMLGFASGDSLGGIVYSMAGGSLGQLRSLDELLLDEPSTAVAIIQRLFQHTNWYEVNAGRTPIREFFVKTYRTDFLKTYDAMLGPVTKACEAAGGELSVIAGSEPIVKVRGGLHFPLPDRGFTGSGPMMRSRPWCLVHGDMHGGNVMAELGVIEATAEGPSAVHVGRISLIDYRQAGPGPRCIDGAALECAIRMADAETLTRGAEPDDSAAGHRALSRVKLERVLLEKIWRPLTTSHPRAADSLQGMAWVDQAVAVCQGVRGAFDDEPVSEGEYVQTCLLYGLRQFRYPMRTVPRLRLVAWVGALYAHLLSAEVAVAPVDGEGG